MEYREYRNEERHEVLILVLRGQRIKVDKQKLIDKSRYFAALLSPNFREFYKPEHTINYEIPLISLEDFVDWIDSDKLNIFASIYDEDKLKRLMLLLELGVLFAVDKLIEDVSDTIERYYLLPKHVIDIWLLAQELSLKVLQDLCLATCLDRFTELPFDSISNLSKQNFLELVGNINVRSSESYLFHIVHKWIICHEDAIPLSILNNKQPKILHGIISSENPNDINTKLYIHCWDGNNFFELTTLTYPKDIIDNGTGKSTIAGIQATARGYNLYLSGGEFGIGTGKFNIKVWRYSLISEKWFFQTTMPNPRRHMVATFSDNKLLLIGGVGRFRRKLNTVDIYDIHTDTWIQGANIPLEFTEVPRHFVFNGRVVIYVDISYICVYYLDCDKWDIVDALLPMVQILYSKQIMPIMLLKTASCYIDIIKPDDMILKSVTETCNVECCNHKALDGTCIEINLCNYLWYSTDCTPYMELYFITTDKNVRHDMLNGIIPICMVPGDRPNRFYVRSIPIQYPEKFRSLLSSSSTISLCNPADMHIQSTNLNTTHITSLNMTKHV